MMTFVQVAGCEAVAWMLAGASAAALRAQPSVAAKKLEVIAAPDPFRVRRLHLTRENAIRTEKKLALSHGLYENDVKAHSTYLMHFLPESGFARP
jgi:hypothetical protein